MNWQGCWKILSYTYEALKKIEMKRPTIRDISKTEPDGNDKPFRVWTFNFMMFKMFLMFVFSSINSKKSTSSLIIKKETFRIYVLLFW